MRRSVGAWRSSWKILSAVVLFSFNGILIKLLPWNALTIFGVRAVIALLVMAGIRGGFHVKVSRGVWIGAFAGMFTSLLYISAVKLTTAANAIVLQYAMPAVVILMCSVASRKLPSAHDTLTVLLVMLGVTLCFIDDIGGGSIQGDVLALLSAVTYATLFFVKDMSHTDPDSYIFFALFLCAPFSLNLIGDSAVSADLSDWLIIIAMGIILGVGNILLSRGMKAVKSVSAAVLSNVEPILNSFWVFLAIGEMPGWSTLVGACVVLVGITFSVLWSDTKNVEKYCLRRKLFK